MNIVTITGISASILSAISAIPQLVKIIKDKRAENVSTGMLIILISGLLLWIVYGILLKDIILVTSNIISVSINSAVLFLVCYYKTTGNNNIDY